MPGAKDLAYEITKEIPEVTGLKSTNKPWYKDRRVYEFIIRFFEYGAKVFGALIAALAPTTWFHLPSYYRDQGYVDDTGIVVNIDVINKLVNLLQILGVYSVIAGDPAELLEAYVEPIFDTLIQYGVGAPIEQLYKVKRGYDVPDTDDISEFWEYDGVRSPEGFAVTAAMSGVLTLGGVAMWVRALNSALIDVGRWAFEYLRDVEEVKRLSAQFDIAVAHEFTRRAVSDVVDIWFYQYEWIVDFLRKVEDKVQNLTLLVMTTNDDSKVLAAYEGLSYINSTLGLIEDKITVLESIDPELPNVSVPQVNISVDYSGLQAERDAQLQLLQQAYEKLKTIRS